MMINFAFLTGSRSEYGIAKLLLKKIDRNPNFNLFIFPNGMHLLEKFGNTVNEIKNDGFEITENINTYKNMYSKADQYTNSLIMIYSTIKKYDIDIMYIIGDRIEAYTAALAAHFLKIPVAHYAGGALTDGAVDNIYRYNITNLSTIHFATSKNNYLRLVNCQLVNKNNVFLTGSTAIDSIIKYKKKNNISNIKKHILITFHPSTASCEPISEILDLSIVVILKYKYKILLTYPNNDEGSNEIISVINKWKNKKDSRITIVKNLGAQKYYEAIENSLFVLGNTSSGIIEVPYFNKRFLNVGTRQEGRDQDDSIVNIPANKKSIRSTLEKQFYLEDSFKCNNIYGQGNSTDLILDHTLNFFREKKNE